MYRMTEICSSHTVCVDARRKYAGGFFFEGGVLTTQGRFSTVCVSGTEFNRLRDKKRERGFNHNGNSFVFASGEV